MCGPWSCECRRGAAWALENALGSLSSHMQTQWLLLLPLKQLVLVKHRFTLRNIALFFAVGPTKQCMKPYLKLEFKLNTLAVPPETFKAHFLPYTPSAPEQRMCLEEPQVQTIPGSLIFQLFWCLGCWEWAKCVIRHTGTSDMKPVSNSFKTNSMQKRSRF